MLGQILLWVDKSKTASILSGHIEHIKEDNQRVYQSCILEPFIVLRVPQTSSLGRAYAVLGKG